MIENEATEQQAEQRRQSIERTISRNDAEIIQGWLEAGLQPLMANGRPLSLPLAKLMRFPMVPHGQTAGEERVA